MKKQDKNTMFLVSNMYPSAKNVRYGIFVKNFEKAVEKDWNVKRIVIVKHYNFLSKLFAYLIFYFKLLMLPLRVKKNDVVYLHFPLYALPALLPFCFRKNKVVLNFHGNDLVFDKPLKKILSVFQKCPVRKFYVVTPSQYYARKAAAIYNKPETDIFVYPSGGIDRSIFYPEKSAKQDGFTLSYVSSFVDYKGWKFFLKAVQDLIKRQQIDKLQVLMVGDGPDKQKIMDFIKKNNLPVTVFSGLTHPEIAEIYNRSDLFVFPTVHKGESLGLVGLEAMACGTPVAGSKLPALQMYLKDAYNGYFFEPGNIDEIIRKILKYYNLPDNQKQQMIQNALNTAVLFDSETNRKKLLHFLSEI
jgi:glycosyltransferase involved in cell wall biosynthesis